MCIQVLPTYIFNMVTPYKYIFCSAEKAKEVCTKSNCVFEIKIDLSLVGNSRGEPKENKLLVVELLKIVNSTSGVKYHKKISIILCKKDSEKSFSTEIQ